MDMKIKDPRKMQELMARRKWFNAVAMAKSISMHPNTIRKAIKGETIEGETAQAIADALKVDLLEIADFA